MSLLPHHLSHNEVHTYNCAKGFEGNFQPLRAQGHAKNNAASQEQEGVSQQEQDILVINARICQYAGIYKGHPSKLDGKTPCLISLNCSKPCIEYGRCSSPCASILSCMEIWTCLALQVCLAVWQANAADSLPGKVLAAILPISAFVAMGFEHSGQLTSTFLLITTFKYPVSLLACSILSASLEEQQGRHAANEHQTLGQCT